MLVRGLALGHSYGKTLKFCISRVARSALSIAVSWLHLCCCLGGNCLIGTKNENRQARPQWGSAAQPRAQPVIHKTCLSGCRKRHRRRFAGCKISGRQIVPVLAAVVVVDNSLMCYSIQYNGRADISWSSKK